MGAVENLYIYFHRSKLPYYYYGKPPEKNTWGQEELFQKSSNKVVIQNVSIVKQHKNLLTCSGGE